MIGALDLSSVLEIL